MKEAFGGTFTIKLLMVFFIIYVTFLGVALNIAKSYRIKNGVINILEQNLYNGDVEKNGIDNKLKTYLEKIPYTVKGKDSIEKECKNTNKKAVFSNGVCIIPGGNTLAENGVVNNYYIVTVYMKAEFPFLGITVPFSISGETMTIYAN